MVLARVIFSCSQFYGGRWTPAFPCGFHSDGEFRMVSGAKHGRGDRPVRFFTKQLANAKQKRNKKHPNQTFPTHSTLIFNLTHHAHTGQWETMATDSVLHGVGKGGGLIGEGGHKGSCEARDFKGSDFLFFNLPQFQSRIRFLLVVTAFVVGLAGTGVMPT